MDKTKKRAVILGAGAPHNGEQPSLLEAVNGVNVLEWLLRATSVSKRDACLVLGYQSDEIAEKYPEIETVVNPNWYDTGSAASLLSTDLTVSDDILVCYGDILFREKLADTLSEIEADIAVAWDSHWKQRYIGRSEDDLTGSEKVMIQNGNLLRAGCDIPDEWASGEFIGLVHFGPKAVLALQELQGDVPKLLEKAHLSGLVEWLRLTGLSVKGVDVAGDWAEVNQPKDIAHFVLGTKAETLARLRKMVTAATIQDQVSFTTGDWGDDAAGILRQAESKFAGQSVVVRSSARSEDAFTHSNAGAYTSVLNVDVPAGLESAIEEVIASYHNMQPDDQVLIQPMVKDVIMSGVAFTRTLERGAPYYVINYEESGSTDGITAGNTNDHKVLYVHRDSQESQIADQRLVPLVLALVEVEWLLSYDALDVEFAVDKDLQVHILQVRPIAVEQEDLLLQNAQMAEMFVSALKHWDNDYQPAAHIFGSQPVYGVMPDWNPAEIIGTNPGRLADSLYRKLILDETWATQRYEYGYRDVRPQPLLTSFAGKPYIDVRASFNSFIPQGISDELAGKLVEFYLRWLSKNPHLHDKVEFDVVPTCLGLDFPRWEQRLKTEAGLSDSELSDLRSGLRQVTCNGIDRTAGDIETTAILEERLAAIKGKLDDYPVSRLLGVALNLLEDCKRYGTLPFAHLARSGFVAVTLLKEAVATGVLSEQAKNQFMTSVRTVSHELTEDAHAVVAGSLSWDAFVEKYGHLRPGTYDITSPAYRDDPEKYLRPILDKASAEGAHHAEEIVLWEQERSAFFNAVRSEGIDYSDEEVEQFLRQAIEGRESAKFVFSRNLSLALDLIVRWGEQYGIGREELASLSIQELLDVAQTPQSEEVVAEKLKTTADYHARFRSVALSCELPALLTSKDDFFSFLLHEGQPNFVGQSRVLTDCVNLADRSPEDQPDVSGKIVMIPQADPGYDWLFGQGIAGLVTMYGGANSHMAIRAAEFAMPAAIGVGEQMYRQLAKASVLELDPANSQLKAIH